MSLRSAGKSSGPFCVSGVARGFIRFFVSYYSSFNMSSISLGYPLVSFRMGVYSNCLGTISFCVSRLGGGNRPPPLRMSPAAGGSCGCALRVCTVSTGDRADLSCKSTAFCV